ncbi:MAG: TonB family protein [Bacteroidetes bacterium]|nr:TonB family protein [Bacteroidota bacterium]
METKIFSIQKFRMFLLIIIGIFSISSSVFSQGGFIGVYMPDTTDRTLSPYFFVKSDDPALDQLPMKSTSAVVDIAGVIADVKVTQIYRNEGKNVLEAVYIFPASTRAAVYSMKMTIGERTIEAKIEERQKARQDYEEAKNDGKSASLLEEERPNVFRMNVANILPGDEIKVEMCYTELLIPDKGVYEFMYPTVVGPRYSNILKEEAPANENWIANPYTHKGEKPSYSFNISLNIQSGMAIREVRCTSHQVDIGYPDTRSAAIKLNPGDQSRGNKDFILQYRLAGDKIESGLLLFEGEDEKFFLAMVQPPAKVTESQIPPREYIFIMDVSGSMNGYPLDISKKLMKDLLSNLRPGDQFNVMLFSGGSRVLSEYPLPVTPENIHNAIDLIDLSDGGGGTEIVPALKRAFELNRSENFARSYIIATDGFVTVEREVFDLIRTNLSNANFFAFGIGSSVNRYFIEGIAHAGMGVPFIVTNPAETDQQVKKFREYIGTPVMSHIKVTYTGFDVYDVEPLSIPDVLAQRPVIIFGKWKGTAGGKIDLTGLTANMCFTYTIDVKNSSPSANNRALKYLWARERIRLLDDYSGADNADNERDKEILDLGLKYNLLTRYTSFVAIDKEVRNTDGKVTTVKQPLPMPEGVSDYAIGFESGSGSAGIMKCVGGIAAPMLQEATGMFTAGRSRDYGNVSHGSEETEDSDMLYTITEQMPSFSKDRLTFDEYIRQNMVYPWPAREQGIEGTVTVLFIVEKDGSVTNIEVTGSLGYGCDEEAIRLIKMTSGSWEPGIDNGKPVRVQKTVLVEFGL